MTTPSQAAPAQAAINGTSPAAAPAEECEECVTSGEKTLAVIGVLIGLGIAGIAIDLWTGGKISGLFGLGRRKEEPSDANAGT